MNDESRFTIHEKRDTRYEKKLSLGSIAAFLMSVFGKSPAKPTAEDFSRMEFKASTQRMGIRFTERIRDVFRFRWIKRR
jgi:hypothetical protein